MIMSKATEMPCVVLAGGRSRRFGSDKGLAIFEGRPLIEHVLATVSRQSCGPRVVNAHPQSHYSRFADIIEDVDQYQGLGPLSGVLAGMHWAATMGYSKVVTVSVDMPILPDDLIMRLNETGSPTYAQTQMRKHYVIGCWKSSDRQCLEGFLDSGGRRVKDWVENCSARPCMFQEHLPTGSFENINTPSDIQRLKRIMASKTQTE